MRQFMVSSCWAWRSASPRRLKIRTFLPVKCIPVYVSSTRAIESRMPSLWQSVPRKKDCSEGCIQHEHMLIKKRKRDLHDPINNITITLLVISGVLFLHPHFHALVLTSCKPSGRQRCRQQHSDINKVMGWIVVPSLLEIAITRFHTLKDSVRINIVGFIF